MGSFLVVTTDLVPAKTLMGLLWRVTEEITDPDVLAALNDQIKVLRIQSTASYRADIEDFYFWLDNNPERVWDKPSTIAAYVRDLAAHGSSRPDPPAKRPGRPPKRGPASINTVRRRVVSIHKLWKLAQASNAAPLDDTTRMSPTKHQTVTDAIKRAAKPDTDNKTTQPPAALSDQDVVVAEPADETLPYAEALTGEQLVQTLAAIPTHKHLKRCPECTTAGEHNKTCAVDTRSLADKRDTALLLIGWYGALRRSELVGITRQKIRFAPEGVVITLTSSNTDDKPALVAIAAQPSSRWDPVTHLQTWLDELDELEAAGKIYAGVMWPGFRVNGNTVYVRPIKKKKDAEGNDIEPDADEPPPLGVSINDSAVTTIVKRRLQDAGIAPHNYSAHSLRSGFVTEAMKRNIQEPIIMLHTRHKSLAVMRSYDKRVADWGDNNASTTLSL